MRELLGIKKIHLTNSRITKVVDFNLQLYIKLITKLLENGYKFYPFKIYRSVSNKKIVILRHDIDRMPQNALKMAEIEAKLGVYGTYYFRINNGKVYDQTIKKIVELGHEVGYHYEEIYTTVRKQRRSAIKGNFIYAFRGSRKFLLEENIKREAYELFKKNLSKMRNITEIKTIAMHGNPISRYDNKIMWDDYDYKMLGIVGEPYFDINWNDFGYLTDTGRHWNKEIGNIRDKVNSRFKLKFKSTNDMIKNIDKLPDKIMFTIHPERWSDNLWIWTKQLIAQNFKNIIKVIISRQINN